MQQEEIAIAAFMGYEFVTIGYFGEDDETEWQRNNVDWMDKVDLTDAGDHFVNVKEDKFFKADKVAYHSSWDNWLMPVVEKIEALGWIVEMARCECEIFKPFERNEDITKGKSKIEAVYKAVVKFINCYNKTKS